MTGEIKELTSTLIFWGIVSGALLIWCGYIIGRRESRQREQERRARDAYIRYTRGGNEQ